MHPAGGLHRRSPIAALAIMAFGYMRLPDLMFGVGHYTRHGANCREAGGLYPQRQRHLPRHRSRHGREGPADRHRGRSGAVAEFRTSTFPSDLEAEVHSQTAVGEQYVALLPRSGNAPPLEGRRRHPRGPHLGAAGHQLPARRDQPRPAGDPARQPQDRHRRGLHRLRRAGPGACAARQGVRPTLAIDARKNLDALTTLIDKSQAGAGHPDRHVGSDPGLGGEPGHDHRAAARPTTPRVPGCSTDGPGGRRRGAGSCSTGSSRRCRSCWPTWSASARSRIAYQREPRAAPGAAAPGHRRSCRPSAWPTATPSRTTRAAT